MCFTALSGTYSFKRTFISSLLFICLIGLVFFCLSTFLSLSPPHPCSSLLQFLCFLFILQFFPWFSFSDHLSSSLNHLLIYLISDNSSFFCFYLLPSPTWSLSFSLHPHFVLYPPPDCTPSQPVLGSMLPPLVHLSYLICFSPPQLIF